MTEVDAIWRIAKLTIDKYGAGAWLEAAMQIDAHTQNGDLDGAAVWRHVANAIAAWDEIQQSDAVH